MVNRLRHMVLVVEHRTFTEAARRAHLSQPALTSSIHKLEEEMGARLFHRGRRGAELTAAGEALLPRARAALAAVADGVRAVAEVQGLRRGEVRLAAGATVCTYLLPRVIARFRRKHKNLRIVVQEAFRAQVEQRLESGDIDLGVVTGDGDEHWRDDELIVVASPKINPRTAGFVTFPSGSSTRDLLLRRFGEVDIVMELSGIAAVKSNVRAGIGKALLSRAAVDADLASGRMVEVRTRRTPIRRQFSLMHRGIDRLPPAAAALRLQLLAAADD